MRIQGTEAFSLSNGPGRRAVIWFQGCTIGCPGCFNPHTHDAAGGRAIEVAEACAWVDGRKGEIEGITFSGGEPFQQPEALLELVAYAQSAGLSVLIFSGFDRAAIDRLPLGQRILENTDVLVAGPYRVGLPAGGPILSSTNQRLHLLSSRYTFDDFRGVPVSEVILHEDGSVTFSGISPILIKGFE
jgi:anaerobic ribonucleoside-triphosphate reductase activating protein